FYPQGADGSSPKVEDLQASVSALQKQIDQLTKQK
ncbi:hypothetical protein H261_09127, partial [Paramagnetospirillum caucaseum]